MFLFKDNQYVAFDLAEVVELAYHDLTHPLLE